MFVCIVDVVGDEFLFVARESFMNSPCLDNSGNTGISRRIDWILQTCVACLLSVFVRQPPREKQKARGSFVFQSSHLQKDKCKQLVFSAQSGRFWKKISSRDAGKKLFVEALSRRVK